MTLREIFTEIGGHIESAADRVWSYVLDTDMSTLLGHTVTLISSVIILALLWGVMEGVIDDFRKESPSNDKQEK